MKYSTAPLQPSTASSSQHISNVLTEELKGIPVVAKFSTTATDGKTYHVSDI